MKLVILDRDGVINEDSDAYIKSVDEWVPLEGSLQAISRLNQAGFTIAVATNQSGLARGYFTEAELQSMHEKMAALLDAVGGHVDKVVYCPHGPDDTCDCRKPKPRLLYQIADHYQTSLSGVWMIGDSLRDLEAAVAAGAQPVLVKTGKGMRTLEKGELPEGTLIYNSLSDATDALIEDDASHA